MARPTTYIPSPEVLARESYALELKQAGYSYVKIAEELGVAHRSDARKIVLRALARVHQEPAAEIRNLEQTRLDRMQTGVWAKALRGDHVAIGDVLRIMERRARLLGLDHADGIAERALQIEADKVRLVAVAFGKALDAVDLTPDQRETMTRVLLTELRRNSEDDGEPVDVDHGPHDDHDDDRGQEPGVVSGELVDRYDEGR